MKERDMPGTSYPCIDLRPGVVTAILKNHRPYAEKEKPTNEERQNGKPERASIFHSMWAMQTMPAITCLLTSSYVRKNEHVCI